MTANAFDLQRWFYAGAIDALNTLRDAGIAGVPTLIVAAFCFGMLHALLPGHGKSVLACYYAGDGRLREALGSSIILILTLGGSAVVIVLGGLVVLRRTIGGAGRAPDLEYASPTLIVLFGLWLLWRTCYSHAHPHVQSALALAFFCRRTGALSVDDVHHDLCGRERSRMGGTHSIRNVRGRHDRHRRRVSCPGGASAHHARVVDVEHRNLAEGHWTLA